MIKFDINKLTTDIVFLKSVTTSLGGSMRVVDQSTGKLVKRDLPYAVARSFIKQNFVSEFITATECIVTLYENNVVWLERRPKFMGIETWQPKCLTNLSKLRALNLDDHYFDGRYLYNKSNEMRHLSKDGKYTSVDVNVWDLYRLSTESFMELRSRNLIRVKTPVGPVDTPPVWNITARGVDSEDLHANVKFTEFDRVDEFVGVNILFVVSAAQTINKYRPYEELECLQLPRLMIELKTVNLPNLPKDVKVTYDTHIPFTHMFNWLLGLMHRAESFEELMSYRALMKYLTSRGLLYKNDNKSLIQYAAVQIPLKQYKSA